ncbi:signal peptidase II [Okibacterium endophyticum]
MDSARTGHSGGRALVMLAAVAVVAYALDQVTKHLVLTNLVEGQQYRIFGDVLIFQFVRNSGAAFSLASGSTWIFSILASAVTIAILVLARRIRSIAWGIVFGLLLAGVVGNLTDRFFREPSFGLGHVIDFISTPWMLPAIYNVADIAIVSSMAIFVILTIRGIRLDGSRDAKEHSDEPVELSADDPGAQAHASKNENDVSP